MISIKRLLATENEYLGKEILSEEKTNKNFVTDHFVNTPPQIMTPPHLMTPPRIMITKYFILRLSKWKNNNLSSTK